MHSFHHCAPAKIAPDVLRRTTISDVHAKLATVRKHCQLCQATTHPNHLPQGKLTPHPVPPRPFTSVATDMFAHTKSKDHRGDFKNKTVVVTCHHSGFLIGWSALERGLTGETLARDYADRVVAIFDRPVEITSANGPQYAAKV